MYLLLSATREPIGRDSGAKRCYSSTMKPQGTLDISANWRMPCIAPSLVAPNNAAHPFETVRSTNHKKMRVLLIDFAAELSLYHMLSYTK